MGREIQRRFLETVVFERSRVLGLYQPIRNEVPTSDIFRTALVLGKRVAYPRVADLSLEFVEAWEPSCFQEGSFGIQEPTGGRRVQRDDFDLLVVPGVGFDCKGGRLGYGKGYFDRFLAGGLFGGKLVGLCYEMQLVALLPREGHDILMDIVVTEKRTIYREGPNRAL